MLLQAKKLRKKIQCKNQWPVASNGNAVNTGLQAVSLSSVAGVKSEKNTSSFCF